MSKVLDFKKKEEGNVLDFNKAKARRDRRGMSYEEFRKTYMKDSIVSLYGEDTLREIFPKRDEDEQK